MGQGTINRIWRRYIVVAATLIVILVIARSVWLFGGLGKEKLPVDMYRKLTDPLHYEDITDNSPLPGADGYKTDESSVYKDIQRYCNPTSTIAQGTEGEVHPGYSLISVYAIIRHGDRTPMHIIPNRTKTAWNCHFSDKMVAENPIINRYMDYMRTHANQLRADDRLKVMPYLPNYKTCPKTYLTPLGALQHLTLGNHLNNVYNKKLGLLSDKWSEADISIESTGYTRTLQSSLALLYGFLPQFDFSKFYIKLSHWLNFCQKNCQCSAAHKYAQQVDEERYELIKNDVGLKDSLDVINTILDVGSSYKPRANHVQDALTPFVCHHRRLPCGPKECLKVEHLGGIINHTKMVASVTNQEGKPLEKLVRLSMHPMLQRIVSGMESAVFGNDSVKFTLFSGHDLTLSPLIDVLTLPNHTWPPYASRVIFELWREDQTNRYFIKVLYNGENLTKHVRFCQGFTNDIGLCTWKRFFEFVIEENLGVFNSTTYLEACQTKHSQHN